MPIVPHFRMPLRLTTDGSIDLVEQDTDIEVIQNAIAILETPPGTRPLQPTLGLSDTTFLLATADEPTRRAVEDQLAKHEPRAEHHAASDERDTLTWLDTVSITLTGSVTNG